MNNLIVLKIIVCVFYLFSGNLLYAQNKVETFFYVIKETRFKNIDSPIYPGIELEFESSRIYTSNNIFKESGILVHGNNIYIEFCTRNDKWYIKQSDKWILFFDNGKKIKSIIYINDIGYKLVWDDACKWDDDDTFTLNLVPPKNVSINHLPTYFFNPKYGFIAVKGDYFFFRKDLFNTNLFHRSSDH